jgi:hypothetical protein
LKYKLNSTYFGARYYDPEIGRWLSVDPLADAAPDMKPYHFTRNNPINRIDSDGNEDFFIKQIYNTDNTSAESKYLIYPTGTFDNVSTDHLRSLSIADIKKEYSDPLHETIGSCLPDNPTMPNQDNSGNATIVEGRFTYEKGQFNTGMEVLFLNESGKKGEVTTIYENYKQGGEKKATGVAIHAGRKDWQNAILSGNSNTKELKGSTACPTVCRFGPIYDSVENNGNIIIIRDKEEE